MTLDAVTIVYGRQAALRGVDLTLSGGEVTALMGRNGSGKSTLLWTLQGTRRRTAGSVGVAGQDPASLDAESRRASVGLVLSTVIHRYPRAVGVRRTSQEGTSVRRWG